jgi:hypothetical protein
MKYTDTVQDVLDMAIAVSDFGSTFSIIPTLASEEDANRIEQKRSWREYDEYLESRKASKPKP